jgi:hypothetical protein
MQHRIHGRRPDAALKERRGVRHQRHRAILFRQRVFARGQHRQQVGRRQPLRSQDPVHARERKLPSPAKKIRKMRLAKTRLPRQQRYAEHAALDSAQHLLTQAFMNLGQVHLWIVCRPQ